ncbi:hypothetical protein C7M84_011239 [Penaeus vannamei]|uniref:Uncharacterized protein n=1 Tax=Penaeus vannamei TaxID=6689 RepID=A0A423T1R0_PENVA|nr:hypothetical protein C7M84_011239 [Penaeus vannamei]
MLSQYLRTSPTLSTSKAHTLLAKDISHITPPHLLSHHSSPLTSISSFTESPTSLSLISLPRTSLLSHSHHPYSPLSFSFLTSLPLVSSHNLPPLLRLLSSFSTTLTGSSLYFSLSQYLFPISLILLILLPNWRHFSLYFLLIGSHPCPPEITSNFIDASIRANLSLSSGLYSTSCLSCSFSYPLLSPILLVLRTTNISLLLITHTTTTTPRGVYSSQIISSPPPTLSLSFSPLLSLSHSLPYSLSLILSPTLSLSSTLSTLHISPYSLSLNSLPYSLSSLILSPTLSLSHSLHSLHSPYSLSLILSLSLSLHLSLSPSLLSTLLSLSLYLLYSSYSYLSFPPPSLSPFPPPLFPPLPSLPPYPLRLTYEGTAWLTTFTFFHIISCSLSCRVSRSTRHTE